MSFFDLHDRSSPIIQAVKAGDHGVKATRASLKSGAAWAGDTDYYGRSLISVREFFYFLFSADQLMSVSMLLVAKAETCVLCYCRWEQTLATSEGMLLPVFQLSRTG